MSECAYFICSKVFRVLFAWGLDLFRSYANRVWIVGINPLQFSTLSLHFSFPPSQSKRTSSDRVKLFKSYLMPSNFWLITPKPGILQSEINFKFSLVIHANSICGVENCHTMSHIRLCMLKLVALLDLIKWRAWEYYCYRQHGKHERCTNSTGSIASSIDPFHFSGRDRMHGFCTFFTSTITL